MVIAASALVLYAGIQCVLHVVHADPAQPYLDACNRTAVAAVRYYRAHDRWPNSLAELPDPSLISFRGYAFDYSVTNLTVSLSWDGKPDPSLLNRLTLRRFGTWTELSVYEQDLQRIELVLRGKELPTIE
jgi:hypothetical protein